MQDEKQEGKAGEAPCCFANVIGPLTNALCVLPLQDKKQEGKAGDAPKDATEVTATFTANVWEVLVKPGDEVEEGQNLVILEVRCKSCRKN